MLLHYILYVCLALPAFVLYLLLLPKVPDEDDSEKEASLRQHAILRHNEANGPPWTQEEP